MTHKPVRTAIFPVGGLGTRFLPATKSMPKEMLTVVDKPIIQYAFEEARDAGIERFVFITGRNKNIISNHFDHAYELQKVLDEREKTHLLSLTKDWLPPAGSIAYIRQQEPLGLGHAVACARRFVGGEPFAVLLADEMFLSHGKSRMQQMMEVYEQRGGNIIGVSDVAQEETYKYGILDARADDGKMVEVQGLVEKPKPEDAPSNISIIGPYILQPEVFDQLAKTEKDGSGEIQLTNAIAATVGDIPTCGLRFEGRRIDCGNKRGFIEANLAFALQQEEMHDQVIDIMRDLEQEFPTIART